MSTTTDMVGESVCVVFNYNTRFSRLCHAAHMPLCANLLSVHVHVVPFVCVERSHYTITLYMERVWVSCVCLWYFVTRTYSCRALDIMDSETTWLFWQNEPEGLIIFRRACRAREKHIRRKERLTNVGQEMKKKREKLRKKKKRDIGRRAVKCGIWCSSGLLWMKMEALVFVLNCSASTGNTK